MTPGNCSEATSDENQSIEGFNKAPAETSYHSTFYFERPNLCPGLPGVKLMNGPPATLTAMIPES